VTKVKVYLDTSVLSAMDDLRHPERAESTRAFWERRDHFEIRTSDVAKREINDTPDVGRRDRMLSLMPMLEILPVTPAIEALAMRYVRAGFFTIRTLDDALHVATASLNKQDVLLSWNFRHLVNRDRRAAINAFNRENNVPTIEIISPPEL
jgi:predicted nucleic acid-binding protein